MAVQYNSVPTTSLSTLPEGAFYGDDGKLYHEMNKVTEGGTVIVVRRPLAQSLEEARDKRWDFYHPTLGWIWEGYKLARDRGVQSIIRDNTLGGMTPPGERPLVATAAPSTD